MTMVLDVDPRTNNSKNQGVGTPKQEVCGRNMPKPDERFHGRITVHGENKPDARKPKEI